MWGLPLCRLSASKSGANKPLLPLVSLLQAEETLALPLRRALREPAPGDASASRQLGIVPRAADDFPCSGEHRVAASDVEELHPVAFHAGPVLPPAGHRG